MTPDSDGFDEGLQTAPAPIVAVKPVLPAWFWSLLVLLLCAGLSVWAADRQQARADTAHAAAMGRLAEETRIALVESLHACEMLLRSVQTVFLVSNKVTATEFSDIYKNLHSRSEFPDLQALGFAHMEVRADGEHFLTEMYVPDAGNQRLAGLDVASQPGNLAALLESRDNDQMIMSAPFALVQDVGGADQRLGVTMRLPVYSPGSPPASTPERRQRTVGSLGASFHIGGLIADAIHAGADAGLDVSVHDVTAGAPRLLYASGPTGDQAIAREPAMVAEVREGGRVWRLRMSPTPTLERMPEWQQSVLWPGLLASALLALLVWSLATNRRRALEQGRRMSQRFRESEQRFRTLNDLLPALVLMVDPDDGRIVYANEAAAMRLGSEVSDGASLQALFEDQDLPDSLFQQDGASPGNNLETMLVSLNGDHFWASIAVTRVVVGDLQRLLLVASDISEQRQLTELLRYQASHDALTELYNRREFERRVMRALDAAGEAPPAALLYIDLDQFKLINDTSGHLAGDQLLSQLALAMAGQLRDGDVLARLGGDEFGILAQDLDAAGALGLAERVRTRIEEHIYVWAQRSYTISASIGVVMIDRPGLTLGEVLSYADSACYMAKDHGRNRIHFFAEDDDEAVHRRSEMEWANRLRWVIEEGRLLLDYQEVQPLQAPVEDPHIELLLRLRDEDGRVVLPGAFLPAAERYGMVAQLDRWVIAEAIAHFDQLHASGRAPGRCSLNLSAATLEDNDLADYVLGLIEKYGVAPSRLCFEITETVAVRDLARAVRFIDRLRSVGCQVALDDFGAGMSSFGYLKNLPVDVIKIDGSFIRDLDGDPMNRSIINAIAEIGHQRGLDVVAEWVTSQASVDTLRALGVDYGQGFALHRPEPVLYQRAQRRM